MTDRQAKLEAMKARAEALQAKAKTMIHVFGVIKAKLQAAELMAQAIRSDNVEPSKDARLALAAWDAAGIVKADQ